MEIGNIKHSFQNGECRRHLKEFAKIGVFRGIFRCSDFNCRNVLVGCDKSYLADYFVSIDEGDIGKRLDIIGKRETWLIKALNKDKTIINEILNELTYDHTKIIMSLERSGNSNIYTLDLRTRVTRRLTNTLAIDTAPCYAPDGERIVFESDRAGRQQLYVMDADGKNVQRISYGEGRYATPVWSPRGDLIAFTKQIKGRK